MEGFLRVGLQRQTFIRKTGASAARGHLLQQSQLTTLDVLVGGKSTEIGGRLLLQPGGLLGLEQGGPTAAQLPQQVEILFVLALRPDSSLR